MRGDGWMEGGLQVGGEGLRKRKGRKANRRPTRKTRDKNEKQMRHESHLHHHTYIKNETKDKCWECTEMYGAVL